MIQACLCLVFRKRLFHDSARCGLLESVALNKREASNKLASASSTEQVFPCNRRAKIDMRSQKSSIASLMGFSFGMPNYTIFATTYQRGGA